MNKDRLTALSVIWLSAALIISAVVISNGMIKAGNNISSTVANSSMALVNGLNNLSPSNLANIEKEAMNSYEAAQYLGISEQELLDEVKLGSFPCKIIQGKYLFSKTVLDEWLAGRR